MEKTNLIGLLVITPDGQGSIISLHAKKVVLHTIEPGQKMKGIQKDNMHYAYDYGDVEIIKGRYNFIDNEHLPHATKKHLNIKESGLKNFIWKLQFNDNVIFDDKITKMDLLELILKKAEEL